jgi:hypothetical protein
MDNNQEGNKAPTAFLVDLVSNRKIPIATPRCRVGRDDLNDIVISGDQSISRFHFIISYENGEFTVQDAKSRHGTFLNGNQLTVSESIKDGDVLKVGVSLFWFVVEGAQNESGDPAHPTRVAAITDDEKAAAIESKVSVKANRDMETTTMPSLRSQEMTQEMQKPDAGLMDKLEQAANAIKMDEKPEPRASLASLLADARANEPAEPDEKQDEDKKPEELAEADKKKEELAALAARDKELLTQMDEEVAGKAEKDEPGADKTAAEAENVEAGQAIVNSGKDASGKDDSAKDGDADPGSNEGDLKEDAIPTKPINKPSDTVTLEALNPPGKPAVGSKVEAVEEADAETVTSSQLTSTEAPSSSSKESQLESEEVEIELVSKGANSDTKAVNAGIIDSSREIQDDIPEDKPSAKVAEKEPSGDQLFSPGLEAEAAEDRGVSVSPSAESVETAAPSMDDSRVESMAGLHEVESGPNGAGSSKSKTDRSEEAGQAEIGHIKITKASSESQDLEVTKFIKAGASAVPDWCKRYFSDEIAKLNTELDDLNEQVRLAQQKIRDVETRVALTRGIRNTLLTTTGDELVEACGKVLSLLGWRVTIAAEDKHELRLEVEDKHICIARVIWTTTKAERSHLGQLSISQTRYWMEKGVEPKGIIIVSKISGEAPTAVGDSPEEIELNDYAAKRNVCLMSTLQLLSLYKEIALSDASPDKLRTSIVNASGWLAGHNLEPGSAEVNDDDTASNQSAGKMSSLASA